MISSDTMGVKDIAAQSIDTHELLAEYSAEDRPVLQRIARAPIEYLLKDPQAGNTIIFDGMPDDIRAWLDDINRERLFTEDRAALGQGSP